ncbi:hypothetical protein [uncultured Draconibacterium sp.]|uniref:hypothetical protein n=1 Tax=uncultured Draconibacterium sp. TaxID=1573823 RepID=UPI0032176540
MAEINRTVYSRELAKYLSPDNAFYKKARRVSEATDAKYFEIPQLGQPSSVHRGEPDVLPAKAKIATDSKLSGTMYQFWADPIVISSESEIVTNYSKRQNHQMQQAAQIETSVADWAAYQWCPTASGLVIPTTGSARASNVTDLTGTRKAGTKVDIVNVSAALRRANIFNLPGQKYGLLTDDLYSDLLKLDDFVDYQKLGVAGKIEMGIIGRIYDIEIMSRSNGYGHTGVIMTAAGGKLEAVGTAATDRPVSLFWHEAYVAYGDASPVANVTANAPGYIGGTLLEAWKRFGASPIREDGKGTVALVEAA